MSAPPPPRVFGVASPFVDQPRTPGPAPSAPSSENGQLSDAVGRGCLGLPGARAAEELPLGAPPQGGALFWALRPRALSSEVMSGASKAGFHSQAGRTFCEFR